MQDTDSEHQQREAEARDYTARTLGYGEPTGDDVIKGFVAAVVVAGVPFLALRISGTPAGQIDIPLTIAGIITGMAVYWYGRARRNRWHRLYAKRLIETSSKRTDRKSA